MPVMTCPSVSVSVQGVTHNSEKRLNCFYVFLHFCVCVFLQDNNDVSQSDQSAWNIDAWAARLLQQVTRTLPGSHGGAPPLAQTHKSQPHVFPLYLCLALDQECSPQVKLFKSEFSPSIIGWEVGAHPETCQISIGLTYGDKQTTPCIVAPTGVANLLKLFWTVGGARRHSRDSNLGLPFWWQF